jgi:hypothetical protein
MSNAASFRAEKPSVVKANMDRFVRSICLSYGMWLRGSHKGTKIRNEEIWGSAIGEMARLGYIVLIEGTDDIHPWMNEDLLRRIKLVKKFPIWVPSPKMTSRIYDQMKATLENGKIVWTHTP